MRSPLSDSLTGMMRLMPESDTSPGKRASIPRLWVALSGAFLLGGAALYVFLWKPRGGWHSHPEEERVDFLIVSCMVAVAGMFFSARTFDIWNQVRKTSPTQTRAIFLIALAAILNAVPIVALVLRMWRSSR